MALETELEKEKLERIVDILCHNMMERWLKDERLSYFNEEQSNEMIKKFRNLIRRFKRESMKKLMKKR